MAMTDDEITQFLSTPRLGMLTTLRPDGSPVTVPVWFEWDGADVRVFSSEGSPKVRRLRVDPRATLLVANHVQDPEAWVAFDGEITIGDSGAIELAERLAERYWDMSRADHRATVQSWRAASAHLRVLSMRPARIRSYNG